MPKNKRTYNANLVKKTLSYSVNDIVNLFGIHKRTVQAWFKGGLNKIDDRKPILTKGYVLIEYLKNKQNKRRSKCKIDEMYCCLCKVPQKVLNNTVDVRAVKPKMVLLMSRCGVCNTKINKLWSLKKSPKISEIFQINKILNKDLVESTSSIINTDIK